MARLKSECEYHPHCGCCGRCISPGTASSAWCPDCSLHTGLVGPFENRTYFARTGKPCPHQVGES